MRATAGDVTFEVGGRAAGAVVQVIGEDRTLSAAEGRFRDTFDGYGVHLDRIGDR